MPYSEKQKVVARIAEHAPEKLYSRNKGMLSMSKSQLHDFATGPIKAKKKKNDRSQERKMVERSIGGR